MDLKANQPGILAIVAHNGRNVKLEEWGGFSKNTYLET